ncbi:hypothetical protein DUI87_15759 [Hirundo rustica rustica]|uniref:Uncharacterized protein n=1 Tax=Hirundo rustica rustica TaxID=333673 RepID=A0A3M0K047_HIRRU|nr:hypothetical protein DUI87_15759 [Hirundo rustica rustica]
MEEGGGSLDGTRGQLPGSQGPVAPDVPRQSVPSPKARVQSQVLALHSSCFPPDLSPGWGLEELLEQWERTVKWGEWDWARQEGEEEPSTGQELHKWRNLSIWERTRELSQKPDRGIQELFQEEDGSDKVLPQGEHSIHQELSDLEVSQDPELSQDGDNSNKEELQDDGECITIHTSRSTPEDEEKEIVVVAVNKEEKEEDDKEEEIIVVNNNKKKENKFTKPGMMFRYPNTIPMHDDISLQGIHLQQHHLQLSGLPTVPFQLPPELPASISCKALEQEGSCDPSGDKTETQR